MADTTPPRGALQPAPAFAAPTTNPYGLADVGDYANPSLVDIDGDGDLDALIGNRAGNTVVQLNTGSATAPAFAAATPNPYGLIDVNTFASPRFVDIDGDGDLDALIGNQIGYTQLQLNTGSATSPAFAAPVTNPYGLTNFGNYANASFEDIDGDGDLDALIGYGAGNTRVQLNTGSPTAPAFASAVTNPYGLVDVGSSASPNFVDIDGDGDLDALIGNKVGNTVVQLNTGSSTAPAFAAATTNPYGLANGGTYATPNFVDIDRDGDLDTLVGERLGNIVVQLNTGNPVAPVTSPTANGTYGIGSVISLTVAFNEAVIVTGTPTLLLETGTIDRNATYTSGSGSNTLSFSYTVQAGDSSADLNQASSTALALSGGSIKDAAGNNAILTLAAPGATGSLGANKAIVIDGVAPSGTTLGPVNFGSRTVSPYGLLDAGSFVNPRFADIDGDGDKDALIGNQDGNTVVQLNTGTSTSPAFAAATTNPYGLVDVGADASPSFVDIDGDGDLDALTGNYDGNIVVQLNTGSATSPAFGPATTNPYGLADAGGTAKPNWVDLDADGDLDVLIGNGAGNTVVQLNTGSATFPAFAAPTTNPYGLANVGSYASPGLADLDSDGDLDAFIGNKSGNTVVQLNTGSSANPAFAAPSTNPYGIEGANGTSLSTSMVDINGDGYLDALTGDAGGLTRVQLGSPTFIAPIMATTANGSYTTGSVIALTVTLTEAVVVDTTGGLPSISLETGTTDRAAVYTGGSGTSTLTFSYTVQAGDVSADLDQLSSTAVSLNGGTIRDTVGNNAILTLAVPGGSGSLAANASIVIDTIGPRGSQPAAASVFAPAATNPYGLGDAGIYASPTFVDIDGDGDLDALIGNRAGNTLVQLNTGGSTAPAFAAATNNPYGLLDAGSYASPSFVDIDGDGDLDALIGNKVGNTLVQLNTSSSTSPAFAAATTNSYGLLDAGSYASPSFVDIDGDGDLDALIGNSNGDTLVQLNTGSSAAPAFASATTNPYGLANVVGYASPRLVDIDGDGDLDALIGNSAGNTLVQLNTGSNAAPAFASATNTPYGLANVGLSASPSLVDIDGDGDLDALIGNSDGNTVVQLNANDLFALAPVGSSLPNGTYGVGSVITLTVTFDEPVIVNTAGGLPSLLLETGAIDRQAVYTSGSGTATLTFSYTVQAGDSSTDLDQASSTALTLNGATMTDAAGNNATLTLATPGRTGSLGANKAIVIDGTPPITVTSVNASTANGAYKAGDVVSVRVSFSEAVTVAGTPTLTLETGSTDRVVNYTSGSGTTTLTFNYTVQAGDTAADLDYVSTSALALNGGTIRNAAMNNAVLTLAAPGAAGSLGANQAIVIDTQAPTVVITSNVPAVKTGETATVTFTFSEDPGTSFAAGDITTTGGTLGAITGASLTRTATFTPTANTTAIASITVANLSYTDAAGNTGSAGTTLVLAIDTLAPTVTGVTSSTANATYATGAVVSIQVSFSEAVTVTGTPQLTLETGTVDRVVNHTGGSGTNTLTFTYTVQAGDASADLDYQSTTALAFNGGTIADAAGNASNLTLAAPGAANSLGAAKAIVIDAAPPVFANAVINANQLVLTYTDLSTLDAVNAPAVGAFAVKVDGVTNVVTGVAVNAAAKTVTLTLTTAVAFGQAATVTVAYTDPTAGNDINAIQDAAGNDAITLAATAVTNVTPDTTAPSFASATVNANQLVMTYTDLSPLDAVNTPAAGTFTVKVGGATNPVTGVAVNAAAKTVTLTLTAPVVFGQAVTVAYTDPTAGNDANAIQDAASNDAATLASTTVTNNTAFVPNSAGTGIGAVAPDNGGLNPAQQGDTLSINTAGLSDPDGLGPLSYQWLRDGQPITGATADKYTLGAGDVGSVMTVAISYTDGAGYAERSVSSPTQRIQDNDGIDNTIESQVPALASSGVKGDGNGDGTQDVLQLNVTSGTAPGTTSYFTLVADANKGLTDVLDTNQAILSQVKVAAPPSNLPAGLNLNALLGFKADVGTAGTKETFSIFVDAATNANGYWVKDKSGTWNNIATAIEAVGSKIRIDFAITDGGAFDADGQANGSIDVSGGAGQMQLSIVGQPADVPPAGFWF